MTCSPNSAEYTVATLQGGTTLWSTLELDIPILYSTETLLCTVHFLYDSLYICTDITLQSILIPHSTPLQTRQTLLVQSDQGDFLASKRYSKLSHTAEWSFLLEFQPQKGSSQPNLWPSWVWCRVCGLMTRRTNLRRHIRNIHKKKTLDMSTPTRRLSVFDSCVWTKGKKTAASDFATPTSVRSIADFISPVMPILLIKPPVRKVALWDSHQVPLLPTLIKMRLKRKKRECARV